MLKNKSAELYRPGVGLMIFNHEKKIFLGKRNNESKKYWQMPQGGIEQGETPINAALREMLEEVGTNNCRIVAETKQWYRYKIPIPSKIKMDKLHLQRVNHRPYIGQIQRWFLIKFLGQDLDINISSCQNSEFRDWKWENLDKVIDLAVPFKRKLYVFVMKEFDKFFI